VDHRTTSGNEPLEGAGLVAFTACGHWWVYPTRATPQQMHDLARFNLGIACNFCLAEWQAATRAQARVTATRIN
jgi:hypothetical protein